MLSGARLLFLVPKVELGLSLTSSNNFLLLDSETFGPAMKSSSRRSYSRDGIYYDSRFSKFYDLVPIQEKGEDQEGDIGDCSLASGSSVSGGSGYSSGTYNMTPGSGQGGRSGGL